MVKLEERVPSRLRLPLDVSCALSWGLGRDSLRSGERAPHVPTWVGLWACLQRLVFTEQTLADTCVHGHCLRTAWKSDVCELNTPVRKRAVVSLGSRWPRNIGL